MAFQYIYRPIQEIGGDYVHLHVDRVSHRVYLTLIDVAGHGLTAALTVNRLFGELERIRAEDPDAGPAEVIELLNRYVHLTMAKHDLYATATAIMLDATTGELKWVNAGHPPAIIRRGDGTLIELASTNVLLGALSYAEFEPHQQRETLRPGDVLVAFTDGAFEARNRAGRQFGLAGIRKTLSFTPPPRDWTRFLTTAVEKHHGGMCDDDVLIATLSLQSLRVRVTPTSHSGDVAEVDADDPAKSMVK
jgi:serine phosphatase RsbU (regulator of sigma subunit)